MREIDGKTALPFSSQMGWDVGSWGWERKGRSWPAARGSPHSKGNQMLQEMGPTEAARYSAMVAVSFIPGSQKEGPLVSTTRSGLTPAIRSYGGMWPPR